MNGVHFDGLFFSDVLPRIASDEVRRVPGAICVVELELTGGRVLDICHISSVTPGWLAVVCRRGAPGSGQADLAMVPYGQIACVRVYMDHDSGRRSGFDSRRLADEDTRAAPAAVVSATARRDSSASDYAWIR